MAYIGKTPTPAPLTSSDIAADIINSTHIGDTAISGFDALATAPADTDEFLISDAGVLKRLDASLVGGGLIKQIVYASHSTSATSTSSTLADTGLTATITPSSSSNKVLVIVDQNGLGKDNADTKMSVRLFRGSTQILNFNEFCLNTSASLRTSIGGTGATFLDSPSTTSATVYKTQFKNEGGGTVECQLSSTASTITLMEISVWL